MIVEHKELKMKIRKISQMVKCGVRLFVLLAVFLSVAPLSAQAAPNAPFAVNTLAETNDASPSDGACLDSEGKCSLRAAIQQANVASDADIITLMDGKYEISLEMPVIYNLTINGVNKSTTILDGPGSGGARGFNIKIGASLVLNDLTMQEFPHAIYMETSNNLMEVDINNCRLYNNHIDSEAGAAIGGFSYGGIIHISGTEVSYNQAPYCGAIFSRGTLTIDQNSAFHHNQATDTFGGAICNVEDGKLEVNGSAFYENSAITNGGAIIAGSGDDSSTGIYLSQIYQNDAGSDGGGIYARGAFSINFSRVSGNTAGELGGGIHYYRGVSATLDSTIVANNQADDGGGIYGEGCALWNCPMTIQRSAIISNTASLNGGGLFGNYLEVFLENTTVSGNKANQDGAGIYADYHSALELFNATVRNNTADADDNGNGMGGGVVLDETGTLELRNSIIAGNDDLTAGPFEAYLPDCFGALTSKGYNLIGMVTAGCTISGDMLGVQKGSVFPGLDARLGPLTNSYSTYYHPPLMGPAVDKGNPAGCVDHLGAALPTDQRGEDRVYGVGISGYNERCDLGAVESWIRVFEILLPLLRR